MEALEADHGLTIDFQPPVLDRSPMPTLACPSGRSLPNRALECGVAGGAWRSDHRSRARWFPGSCSARWTAQSSFFSRRGALRRVMASSVQLAPYMKPACPPDVCHRIANMVAPSSRRAPRHVAEGVHRCGKAGRASLRMMRSSPGPAETSPSRRVSFPDTASGAGADAYRAR